MAKANDMTVGINMQKYYDDLVLFRNSLNKQIEELEKSPSICTHKRTMEQDCGEGKRITICKNSKCRKVIDAVGLDYVSS